MRLSAIATVAVAAFGLATAALATPFTAKWSGAPFGNGASAIGYFNIDTTSYPLIGVSDGSNLQNFDPAFTLYSLTVTGTTDGDGDGVFNENDFIGFIFEVTAPLDYTKQLIGQPMLDGYAFGDPNGVGGDFNLFGSEGIGVAAGRGLLPALMALPPTGTNFFTLTTINGENLYLISLAPTTGVPEPASWALLIVGFGLTGAVMRRRAAATA
jgi:hypothetical protein